MDRTGVPESGGAERGDPTGAELSAADLFTLLWEALADLLGTAATAALLRRAVRHASLRSPDLAELVIARAGLEYRYTLPSTWKHWAAGTPLALRILVLELWPLLVELTGPVVVGRLLQIPELRERGIVPPQEEGP